MGEGVRGFYRGITCSTVSRISMRLKKVRAKVGRLCRLSQKDEFALDRSFPRRVHLLEIGRIIYLVRVE